MNNYCYVPILALLLVYLIYRQNSSFIESFSPPKDTSNVLNDLKGMGFNPMNILDIGAWKGTWTDMVKNIYPNSNYTLIEPVNHKELGKYKNVIQVLLLDKETEIDWYQATNDIASSGNSVMRENTKHFKNTNPIKKRTTTLDRLFNSNQIFDLIKIDVQGAELLVLEGGKNLIQNTSFIILEIPFVGEYNQNAPDFLSYITYMDRQGFVPYDIVELHYMHNFLIQIDIIFIRKNHPIHKKVQTTINAP